MDCKVKAVIFLIVDLILAKRHIANRKVEKIRRKVRTFKSADNDTCLRVKLPGDASADIINFYAIQF